MTETPNQDSTSNLAEIEQINSDKYFIAQVEQVELSMEQKHPSKVTLGRLLLTAVNNCNVISEQQAMVIINSVSKVSRKDYLMWEEFGKDLILATTSQSNTGHRIIPSKFNGKHDLAVKNLYIAISKIDTPLNKDDEYTVRFTLRSAIVQITDKSPYVQNGTVMQDYQDISIPERTWDFTFDLETSFLIRQTLNGPATGNLPVVKYQLDTGRPSGHGSAPGRRMQFNHKKVRE